MAFVALRSSDIITYNWDRYPYSIRYNEHFTKVASKDDTYLIIFNNAQKDMIKWFEAREDFKVLFKSELAVNKQPGHGTQPRNFLIVFELV